MADINIASPGGDEEAVRNALRDLLGWRSVDRTGAPTSGPAWDHAVDGSAASVDFIGLAGARDIMVICRGITKSSTGVIGVHLSVNNGSSFYNTSGDYVGINNGGGELNVPELTLHSGGATAARGGVGVLHGANIDGGLKVWHCLNITGTTDYNLRNFVASTSPVNALRVLPHAGGNFTAGTIEVRVR